MIEAAATLALFVLFGAVLNCLSPRPAYKDVYVDGRRVELVPLSGFDVYSRKPLKRLIVVRGSDGRREVIEVPDLPIGAVADIYVTVLLEGLLLRGITDPPTPARPRADVPATMHVYWNSQRMRFGGAK